MTMRKSIGINNIKRSPSSIIIIANKFRNKFYNVPIQAAFSTFPIEADAAKRVHKIQSIASEQPSNIWAG